MWEHLNRGRTNAEKRTRQQVQQWWGWWASSIPASRWSQESRQPKRGQEKTPGACERIQDGGAVFPCHSPRDYRRVDTSAIGHNGCP